MTRDELRQIPQLHRQIERDKEQLRFLREKATAIPSTLPDHERVQTSPSGSGNRYVEDAVDLNKEIQKKELYLAELQAQAKVFIRSLPRETETDKLTIKVLKCRYLKCYRWSEIEELLGYAERHLRRIEYDCVKNVLPCPHS